MARKVVALFDFDGTITRGDSFVRFLWHAVPRTSFFVKTCRSLSTLLLYLLGRLSNGVAKEAIFGIFFSGQRLREFNRCAMTFGTAKLPRLVRAESIRRIRWHLNREHECVLVSASVENYLIPWAEKEGFSKVLATRVEVDRRGVLTGRFLGQNCYGPEKVRRVRAYLGELSKYEIYAYGDSRGDKELLEIADHPYYNSLADAEPSLRSW